MPISVVSYGGRLGFWARVHFPRISFSSYSRLQMTIRKRTTIKYIEHCLELREQYNPIFINIETINRCNGRCDFCPANVKEEKRPYKKMEDVLFNKIINELCDMNYRGIVSPYINNEPFLDKRMPNMLQHMRNKLPNSTILVFTNGSLLTPNLLDEIKDCVDVMIVNNYNDSYDLTESSTMILNHIKQNESKYTTMNVTIQRRFSKEYLTNRAGTAPNKVVTQKTNRLLPCIMPFTDINIFPDGVVGLCCNDCLEKTNYGDINTQSIIEVFHSEKLVNLRKTMYRGRDNIDSCRYCDVFDSGIRLKYIKKLNDRIC